MEKFLIVISLSTPLMALLVLSDGMVSLVMCLILTSLRIMLTMVVLSLGKEIMEIYPIQFSLKTMLKMVKVVQSFTTMIFIR